ncbi:DinB family protein [Epilithonimonas mollis]|uniref:DinB superfamily protein n=1 Tax=Epilithonimonas mollis TaxID=216903 RepID=A0A1M6UU29_9FLAO|nr:DinB family protein [Epilithonimonas mollis]SHK72556.1 DinB superfamily protein [Epilithonimonas mollis]
MEALFKTWETSRKIYLSYFENYSLDQLNKIPNGFNNNLIWHIGHIIVTQQKLIYRGSNLPGYISNNLLTKYQSGTKPDAFVPQKEADELKTLLTSLIEPTIDDFLKGIFINYNERTTGTGFHLSSINDAFESNNYHEGMHLGYMLSIRKFV